ncbi:endo-1,4-beta-xylanase [Niallia circulans]|uniref:endo-1,4-beta-xylanase n=1 Tax=Niallia circulans TaxID=1397 RepID=UPI001639FCEC|nr:endo-1,4-beta-xylanase [Niallia circulans]
MNKPKKILLLFLIIILALISIIIIGKSNKDAKENISLRSLADNQNFYVGAAVNSLYLDKDEKYKELINDEVNLVTTENEMKFDIIHPEEYRYDFSAADKIVNFAKENNQKIRGHTLVWHHRIPKWLEEGQFTKNEVKEILKQHIQTVVGRYKGQIYAWDVVNEAFNDDGSLRENFWLKTLGPQYIEWSFQWAHEADPNALLFYNDFGIEMVNSKSIKVLETLNSLKQKGVPIDGIGLQMHTHLASKINISNLENVMQNFSSVGLQIQITELDIGIAEGKESKNIKSKLQAKYYSDIFKICLKNEDCTAIVLWGITDKYTYRIKEEEPLIFDTKYKPKEAYWSISETLQTIKRKMEGNK